MVTAALTSLPADGGTLQQTRLRTALLALRK
jgi:hypothetical protein